MEFKVMNPKILSCLVLAAGMSASGATAQSTYSAFRAADGVPQPHLMAARRLADQDNFWKTPILNTCYREDSGFGSQQIIKDPPPTKMTDNLYFLGLGSVSAWAIDTSDGIVLIDSLDNVGEADKYIIGGLRQLGADPSRIKAVIVSHGHGDHYGGAKYIQDKYGASIYMSVADWAFAAKNANSPNNRAKGFGPVPRHDIDVRDGDSLTLGDTVIRMFVTPGHTPGTLSLLIPTRYKGQPHMVVFHGGVTSSNGLTPELHEEYDRTITHLAKVAAEADADGYMANHGNFDDIARKIIHLRTNPDQPNPFLVGTGATQRWLEIAKECNLNNRDVDVALAAKRKRGTD
jgi:metallo-beta-lactamase class B